MYTPRSQGALRTAAVFSLCALFAVLAMGLTLLSSSVYRATVEESNENYTQRVALSYLVNQLRRGDETGGIAFTKFGDGDAITLTEYVDGSEYVTYLYCYDGQLRELYTERGNGLTPADGTAILPLKSVAFSAEGRHVQITVTDDTGNEYVAAVAGRSTAGEGSGL